MREFDRITTDYQKLGGLPHFRDTTITVSEVVRLVMSGTPNIDILAQYPDLEPDDIHEALAFALQDLKVELQFQVFHDRHRMADIAMHSYLLAKGFRQLTEFSDENKHEYTEKIQRSSEVSRGAWAHFDDRVNLSYFPNSDEIEWLWRIIEDVNARARYYKVEAIVEFNIQKKLPPIYAKGTLAFALTYLIYKLPFGHQVEHTVLDVNIIPTDTALFRIHHRYKVHFDHPDWPGFLHWRDPIVTAALIIHQHGSELKITPDDKGVTFEFELPVWQGDTEE